MSGYSWFLPLEIRSLCIHLSPLIHMLMISVCTVTPRSKYPTSSLNSMIKIKDLDKIKLILGIENKGCWDKGIGSSIANPRPSRFKFLLRVPLVELSAAEVASHAAKVFWDVRQRFQSSNGLIILRSHCHENVAWMACTFLCYLSTASSSIRNQLKRRWAFPLALPMTGLPAENDPSGQGRRSVTGTVYL